MTNTSGASCNLQRASALPKDGVNPNGKSLRFHEVMCGSIHQKAVEVFTSAGYGADRESFDAIYLAITDLGEGRNHNR